MVATRPLTMMDELFLVLAIDFIAEVSQKTICRLYSTRHFFLLSMSMAPGSGNSLTTQ